MSTYFKESAFFCKSLFVISLSISPVFAKINEIQTTRLMSTAGTGIGAVLMDESTILNPAPLAFFNMSSIYFQKGNIETKANTDEAAALSDADQLSFIASDSSSNLSGSIGYFKQSSNLGESRKTWSFGAASPINKSSSFGVNYQLQDEVRIQNGGLEHHKYKIANFGFFHAVDQNFSFGALLVDAFGNKDSKSKAFLGTQYVYDNMISLMLDAGTVYKEDLQENLILRSALQVRFYNDFYLRFGAMEDKSEKTRGNGIGVGWVQPKLVIDLALANNKSNYIEQGPTKDRTTSFSLAYKF